jgi:hypothetical protein
VVLKKGLCDGNAVGSGEAVSLGLTRGDEIRVGVRAGEATREFGCECDVVDEALEVILAGMRTAVRDSGVAPRDPLELCLLGFAHPLARC